MKLVVLMTALVEKGFTVAEAWQQAGAPGVTIVQMHGLYRLQQQVSQGSIELPRMVISMAAALAAILDNAQTEGIMFLSLVPPTLVDPLIAAANAALGDLTEPGHGVLFVIDVERAIGVRNHATGVRYD
jgi:nitrogen regulatory protein PII